MGWQQEIPFVRNAGLMAKTKDLDGKLVVLVGGSGFIGTHVAQELLSRGARLRVAARHPERAYRLKPLGNLGQIQLCRCDVARPETLDAVMAGADAAVYLAGTFGADADMVQAYGPGAAAKAAKAAGASAFVHISAIGANAESDVRYARTKGEGEAAVRAAFPKATILRPSVVFGEDDRFINMFAGLISALPALPVFGPGALMQPLHVDDMAGAVAAALSDPASHGGKTYEIAGPEILTMSQINHAIAKAQHRKTLFAELPDFASAAFAALTGWLPGAPMSMEQWKLLKAGNVASGGYPGLAELGIKPRPLGLFLDRWMVRYRKHGRFGVSASA